MGSPDTCASHRVVPSRSSPVRTPPRPGMDRPVRSRERRCPKGHATERRQDAMTDHKVVGREEWQAARDELLKREKEHTRMADELARQRRELPWLAVEKEYRFDADEGTRTLAELFDGRSQLLIYHFMFGPTYEAGCPTCSSMAD